MLQGLFENHILLCSLCGWFIAQALKVPIYLLVEHKLDFHRFFGSGGMPSSHSALVISLMVMVGYAHGLNTVEFAITVVLAMIVMYDAAGVRRETGVQATVINQILRDVLINGKQISDDELKELVGHTPLEVLGGAIIGLLTSILYIVIIL